MGRGSKPLRGLITTLVAFVCTAAPAHAIVGGSDAGAGEFPSVARIAFGPAEQFHCTGTLIDRTHILTAGHCSSVTGTAVASPAFWPAALVKVWIGSNKEGQGEQVQVNQVHITPDYLGLSWANDVSILVLAKKSENSPTRVAGPSERSLWTAGTYGTIAGWGATNGTGGTPDTLHKATVPITTDAYCRQAYGEGNILINGFDQASMFCAGYPQGGVDACQGDSGGPMFAGGRVVGVISWGQGCGEPGYPGVYSRVADTKLRTWVKSIAPSGVAN